MISLQSQKCLKLRNFLKTNVILTGYAVGKNDVICKGDDFIKC